MTQGILEMARKTRKVKIDSFGERVNILLEGKCFEDILQKGGYSKNTKYTIRNITEATIKSH